MGTTENGTYGTINNNVKTKYIKNVQVKSQRLSSRQNLNLH